MPEPCVVVQGRLLVLRAQGSALSLVAHMDVKGAVWHVQPFQVSLESSCSTTQITRQENTCWPKTTQHMLSDVLCAS